ncbi:MAG: class I SAM-dependent methyltransferase [Candidatus Binatia bacterium]
MGTHTICYNVLIASPSDLQEERREIVEAICKWNFQNRDRGVIFLPLLWECHAVADFDKAPQEAINQQLLGLADFLIAVFKGRLGTPTDGFPAGTIEELSKRSGRAAVFFPSKYPDIPGNAPNQEELFEQLQALKKFKQQVAKEKRFALDYDGPDDLANKVGQTLLDWAINAEEKPLAVSVYPAPYQPERLLRQEPPKGKKACVLMYNTELRAFRSSDDLETFWGLLREFPWVDKVVLLLPRFKIDRLKHYIAQSTGRADPELVGRFFVCPERNPGSEDPLFISSGLAFMLLRYGTEPAQGDCAPISHMSALAEPFASAKPSSRGSPDLEWDYNYYLELHERRLQEKLQQVWDLRFQGDKMIPVSDLVQNVADKSAVNHVLASHIDYKSPRKIEDNIPLIQQLREKLFDPNVPSYLLNTNFDMLDWNTAFELVFPTTLFYRHESVKEFVECLSSKDETKQHGAELIRGLPSSIDMEQLAYTSPKYGSMRFTKIASKVFDPSSGEQRGWIVALNVNQVERWDAYERDLRLANEKQALMSDYARSCDRVLSRFPGYLDLAQVHAKALGSCRQILDLGCGLSRVTAELFKTGQRFTAVDQNDAMLDAARKRCQSFRAFTSVKANIETLHKPDPRYSFE